MRWIVVEGFAERWSVFCSDVVLEIKKNLTNHRSSDPAVRIELKCEMDVGTQFVDWVEGKMAVDHIKHRLFEI